MFIKHVLMHTTNQYLVHFHFREFCCFVNFLCVFALVLAWAAAAVFLSTVERKKEENVLGFWALYSFLQRLQFGEIDTVNIAPFHNKLH